MSLDQKIVNAIHYCFYFLVFFTPLVLFPASFELFEFNKMMLVYALTVIIVSLWLGRIVLAKKIIWQKTPLDLFIMLFLISQALSTVFSIDPHTSIWGYYSRSHGGLLSSLCYSLLFWAYASNISTSYLRPTAKNSPNIPKTVYFILASAVLVAVYGILEHFGIDKNLWVQDVQNRVFSTLGQPNWLAAYLNAIIFIPLALFWQTRTIKPKIIYLALYILFYITLVFTKSKSGLAAYWLVMPIFYFLSYRLKKNINIVRVGLLNILLFATIGIFFYPQMAQKIRQYIVPDQTKTASTNLITLPSGKKVQINGSPTSQIRRVVWQGALNIWKNYPLLGSGNETFSYSYYNFRPVEHNQNSEWDFLYNKAHNEYLNYLACTGLIGLLAVLIYQFSWPLALFFTTPKKTTAIFIGVFLVGLVWIINPGHILDPLINRFFIYPPIILPLGLSALTAVVLIWRFFAFMAKKQSFGFIYQKPAVKLSWLNLGLLMGYLTIFLTNFYGFSVVIIGLYTFLFPAISLSSLTKHRQITKTKTQSLAAIDKQSAIQLAVLLTVALILLYKIASFWNADRFYAKGKNLHQSGYYLTALEPLIKAESINAGEPLYKSQLGETAAGLAYLYYLQDSSDSAELVADLTNLSIEKGNEALMISPFHLNFYKSMAKIYLSLANINPDYTQKAIDILVYSTKLSPTDPKLLVNIALLQKKSGQIDQAVNNLNQAIQLKPDYDQPYVYLARIWQEKNEPAKAREVYQNLLDNHYPPNQEAVEYLKNSN